MAVLIPGALFGGLLLAFLIVYLPENGFPQWEDPKEVEKFFFTPNLRMRRVVKPQNPNKGPYREEDLKNSPARGYYVSTHTEDDPDFGAFIIYDLDEHRVYVRFAAH